MEWSLGGHLKDSRNGLRTGTKALLGVWSYPDSPPPQGFPETISLGLGGRDALFYSKEPHPGMSP